MAALTAIPMNEPDEEPALLIEITPINRLLRIARDEIRQVQQNASREIMRGLAHEIKNPLGGLRGAAQLLEKQLESEELKEYTSVIISEADRLQTLLNRILGPNRIPEKRLVNIHEVLERVRSLVYGSDFLGVDFLRAAGKRVDIHSDLELARVVNDKRRGRRACAVSVGDTPDVLASDVDTYLEGTHV